jgi:Glu-tRNA(Gln) amidotransferase subunit E-like FAD-binding protein
MIMADEPVVTPPVTQGNDQTARTATGEIKDQQTTQPQGIPDPTKAPEAKPPTTEAKPADAKAEAKPATDAKGAPEKYDFKAPEGQTLDTKVIEAVTPIFKELGLTNDQAQKLIAFQAARDGENMKLVETTRTEWRDKIIKDAALGNGTDGLKSEAKANIAKAMDALGASKAAFVEALDLTGAGDNPAVVAAMNAFGKLLSEGTPVRGAAPSPAGQTAPGAAARPSPAAAMYPNLATSSKP